MKSIMITGVKGVGKSTIVSEVSQKLKLPTIDYADLMLEVMGANNKDIIELLLPNERMEIIKSVRKSLERQFTLDTSNRFVLFENHLTTVRNCNIDIPELEIYWRFNIFCIIVLYANPDQILERRRSDLKRNRPEEDITLIYDQQRTNALQAELISIKYNIPLKFIYNGDIYTSVNKICQWLQFQIS